MRAHAAVRLPVRLRRHLPRPRDRPRLPGGRVARALQQELGQRHVQVLGLPHARGLLLVRGRAPLHARVGQGAARAGRHLLAQADQRHRAARPLRGGRQPGGDRGPQLGARRAGLDHPALLLRLGDARRQRDRLRLHQVRVVQGGRLQVPPLSGLAADSVAREQGRWVCVWVCGRRLRAGSVAVALAAAVSVVAMKRNRNRGEGSSSCRVVICGGRE
mmetsp:Transcript_74399/g.205010  ORF Transcript_74399/g.205010 Transcript_74399/m.205010 type:complete len:217 (+) Transcript_74399:799-1449(+)